MSLDTISLRYNDDILSLSEKLQTRVCAGLFICLLTGAILGQVAEDCFRPGGDVITMKAW